MRLLFELLAASLLVVPQIAAAQGPGTREPEIAGIRGRSDFIRVSGGVLSPVQASGSLKDWDRGTSVGLSLEDWGRGGNGGPSRTAFGLAVNYSRLPFVQSDFLNDFRTGTGKVATSASGKSAKFWDIESQLRIRAPSYQVFLPSVLIGLGYYNFKPGTVTYQSSDGAGVANMSSRSGASVAIGAGLDVALVSRTAVFAEGMYVYGWPRQRLYQTTANSQCLGNGCDVNASTKMLTLRTGLRVRVSP